jgi:hypothetical protein
MAKLKKGDIVEVYEDPITREKLEGKARLHEFHFTTNDGLEYWEIEFLNEPGQCFQRLLQ